MYIIQEKLYFQEIDYVNKNVKGIIYENVKGEDTMQKIICSDDLV